jgi:lipase chaperone LimK
MEQAESLMMPGKMSGEQIEDRYQELLRSQPTTQEDELKRQQQLSILQEFMAAHRRNLSQCQGMMVVGQFEFSSD